MDQGSRGVQDPQRQVGEVLLRNWDPRNVVDQVDREGAFAAYVGPVYQLLAAGATDREVAEHLVQVETEALGFQDSEWRMLIPVARKLRKLYRRVSADSPAP